jgi:hypothetical protein
MHYSNELTNIIELLINIIFILKKIFILKIYEKKHYVTIADACS